MVWFIRGRCARDYDGVAPAGQWLSPSRTLRTEDQPWKTHISSFTGRCWAIARICARCARGRRFPRRQLHRDLRLGDLCDSPRKQLRHRFCAEPRRALQRALPVRLRDVHGLRHYGGPRGLAAEQAKPFALKAIALFLLVRAVFVALTHMAPSPIDPQKPGAVLQFDFLRQRPFFSGHTGLPFLAALAFWHIPQWRAFYLALTAFFGAVVLLGHYHYSIDMLAALFITHGVFQISCWLFGRDYALFRSSENLTAPRPAGKPEDSGGRREWTRCRSCCTSSETNLRRPANPTRTRSIRAVSAAARKRRGSCC